MDLDNVITDVLGDDRTRHIPVLYIIEVILILDDLDLIRSQHEQSILSKL